MNRADSRTVAFRVGVKEWETLRQTAENEDLSVGAYAKKVILSSVGVSAKVRRNRST